MSVPPRAAEVPGRLRVAIIAAAPATAARLAAIVVRAGHQIVAAADPADAILTDGSVDAAPEAPILALGSAAGNFAGRLPAEAGPAQLDAALRAVAAGLAIRPLALPQLRFGPLPEDGSPALTPREIEVLTALADGLSNKAIARRLGISPHTVKFHLDQLFRKLGAGCRAEAVAKGLKQRIVEF
jgi:two-component system, NarL family, nitrate/nitrite response regulator NarL